MAHAGDDLKAEAQDYDQDEETTADSSTELGSDDGDCTPVPPQGQEHLRRVRFADESAGIPLEEVLEIEAWNLAWKDHTKFSVKDLLEAEREWHTELPAQLQDEETRTLQSTLRSNLWSQRSLLLLLLTHAITLLARKTTGLALCWVVRAWRRRMLTSRTQRGVGVAASMW